MEKIAIVTDSNSGITQEEGRRLGVSVLPMPFYINDVMYLEGITLTQEEFYEKLKNDEAISTSQPSPAEVCGLWDNLLKEYDEVVHIPMSSGLSASCETAMALAREKLAAVNLKDTERVLGAYPSELSGGMRQRAALIRTLALNPDILLLDEPFSALDYQTRLRVSDDIGEIIKEEKKTALLVTHDLSEAIAMGDRVVVLSERPGTIRKIIDINFDGLSPLERRNAPEFQEYFHELWRCFS